MLDQILKDFQENQKKIEKKNFLEPDAFSEKQYFKN